MNAQSLLVLLIPRPQHASLWMNIPACRADEVWIAVRMCRQVAELADHRIDLVCSCSMPHPEMRCAC